MIADQSDTFLGYFTLPRYLYLSNNVDRSTFPLEKYFAGIKHKNTLFEFERYTQVLDNKADKVVILLTVVDLAPPPLSYLPQYNLLNHFVCYDWTKIIKYYCINTLVPRKHCVEHSPQFYGSHLAHNSIIIISMQQPLDYLLASYSEAHKVLLP